MTSVRIDPQLVAKLNSRSVQEIDLIVRVKQADDETEQALQSLGLAVRNRLELVPTFTVTGSTPAARKLIDQSWVLSVEEDQPVHTM